MYLNRDIHVHENKSKQEQNYSLSFLIENLHEVCHLDNPRDLKPKGNYSDMIKVKAYNIDIK